MTETRLKDKGRRSVVDYDGELASEWLPVRTLPCAVSLALRRRPCGVAILPGCLINSWAFPNFNLEGRKAVYHTERDCNNMHRQLAHHTNMVKKYGEITLPDFLDLLADAFDQDDDAAGDLEPVEAAMLADAKPPAEGKRKKGPVTIPSPLEQKLLDIKSILGELVKTSKDLQHRILSLENARAKPFNSGRRGYGNNNGKQGDKKSKEAGQQDKEKPKHFAALASKSKKKGKQPKKDNHQKRLADPDDGSTNGSDSDTSAEEHYACFASARYRDRRGSSPLPTLSSGGGAKIDLHGSMSDAEELFYDLDSQPLTKVAPELTKDEIDATFRGPIEGAYRTVEKAKGVLTPSPEHLSGQFMR
jgi:hypothetical protein